MADTSVPQLLGDQTTVAAQYRNLGNSQYAPVVARPTEWGVVHLAAANTQATASKAAGGAGVRHVCTGFVAVITSSVDLGGGVIQNVAVRDGATGAGTVLLQAYLTKPLTAGIPGVLVVTGLNLVGTANTAMTVEVNGASGANTFQSVSFTGYSVS